MTGSVARHCEPTHNWTLDSGLRCHRTCVRSTQDRRRGEPPLLNGPVTSRMISTAVVNEGVRHRLCKAPAGPFRQSVPDPFIHDTGRCVSDSLQSTHRSAERRQMFEATPRRIATLRSRSDRRLQPRNSSNRKSTLSRLATRKQGKPKQYDRGENSSLEKSAKFYRRTGTYCLTSKDIQMLCRIRIPNWVARWD